MSANVLRVLVVDDSAYNRRTIAEMLSALPGVDVVGKAADGDEALRLAATLSPDLITLDLEMPRMDGFTFLRLLMARQPTPVIVVSGYANKENVFRALELGAIDFIAKPSRTAAGDLVSIQAALAEKIQMVRQLAPASLARHGSIRAGETATQTFTLPELRNSAVARGGVPRWVVLIAASTGGPTGLLELLVRIPSSTRAAFVVAQHMPERFTRTFAERLDRLCAVRVHEAAETEVLAAGTVLVCPGGQCVDIVSRETDLVARVGAPRPGDRYAPSADRLFETGAQAAGDRVLAVVITGMGDDGARGVVAVKAAGGRVIAESQESAVVYGMPAAAARTGAVDEVLTLQAMAERLPKLTQ